MGQYIIFISSLSFFCFIPLHSLIGLALSATVGIILLFIGCALHYEPSTKDEM